MKFPKLLTSPEILILQRQKYQGIMFLGGCLVLIWGYVFTTKLNISTPGYFPLALLCWLGSFSLLFNRMVPYTEILYTFISSVAIFHHFYLIEINSQDYYFLVSMILAMIIAALPLQNFGLFAYFTALPALYAFFSFIIKQDTSSGVMFMSVFSIAVVLFYSTWERIRLERRLHENQLKLDIEKNKSALSSKMAALGEMAGGIAHEINNPLTILKGQLTLMGIYTQTQTTEKKQITDLIATAHKTIDRIAKIVQSLRHLSQKSTNEDLKQVELSLVLEDVLTLSDAKLNQRQIAIQYQMNQWATCVRIREIQFEQVIINLLNNAIDAVEKEPIKEIKLDLKTTDKMLILRISDSGHGIPVAIREKIMEPFFTTKEIGKGTGLGLSTSKGITEANQGRLYLDENHPQTSFVVEWPYFPL